MMSESFLSSATESIQPDAESYRFCLSSFYDADQVIELVKNLEQLAQDTNSESNDIEIAPSYNGELLYQRLAIILDNYQEQPHVTDSHLPQLIDRLFSIILNTNNKNTLAFHLACKFLYHISKMRGFKGTTRHFPHEASQLHLAISLLQSQNVLDADNWQTRHVMLLWISVLVLTPFHLKRFDDGEEQQSLMQRIYCIVLEYLPLAEKSSDAAAFLAARFFSRPEVTQTYLNKFVDWACNGRLGCNGVLLALAYLFKLGKRDEMRACAVTLLDDLLTLDILSDKYRLYSKNLVKLVQRIGLCFLKVRVASWRYQRGRRNLLDTLPSNDESSCRSVSEDEKGDDRKTEEDIGESEQEEEEEDEENEEVLEKIGEIVNLLLQALRHQSTQVRWSAAKGCGRISERLSAEQADQIVQGILQLLQPMEQDGAWQGGCLALAELSRRGLLLPVNLPAVMKALSNALTYEQNRGGFSIGANVRDAACYVCWAFARAFDRDVLLSYADQLAANLVVVALFDREVNIRRAASAAFQENTGRQGNFPFGIEVLTTIDHMAVSLPSRSFIELSVKVAKYEPYRRPILDHLMKFKVNHWDANIRQLAAKALGQLCSVLDPVDLQQQLDQLIKFAECNNPFEKHGGLLSIGALLQGLAQRKQTDSESNWPNGKDLILSTHFDLIRNLLVNLDDKLLHVTCHGELICEAVCQLIRSFSLAKLNIYDDSTLVEKSSDILLKCLSNANDKVRLAAAESLSSHSAQFVASNYDRRTRLTKELMNRLRAGPEHSVQGSLAAIGMLPKEMLDSVTMTVLLGTVLRSLNAQLLRVERSYSKARAIAVRSLCRLILNADPPTLFGLRDLIQEVFQYCLQDAMHDYQRHQQRDVAFEHRQAAVESIGTLYDYFSKQKVHLSLLKELTIESLAQLSPHCVCPQDSMRRTAITSFRTIVACSGDDQIKRFQPWFEEEPELDSLYHEQHCYRFFVRLFDERPFVSSLWKGYALSTGSLSEFVATNSRKSFFTFIRQQRKSNETAFHHVIESFLVLLSSSIDNELLSIPLLRTFEMLIQSGLLDSLPIEQRCRAVQDCWNSVKKSEDIRKITVCSSTLSSALRFEDLQKQILGIMMILLCYRYPVIRVTCAEHLYSAFSTLGDYGLFENDPDKLELVLGLLSDSNWNEGDLVHLRQIRSRLCAEIGIKEPIATKKQLAL